MSVYRGIVYGMSFDWDGVEPMPILHVLAKTEFDSNQPIDVKKFLDDKWFDVVFVAVHDYGAMFFSAGGEPLVPKQKGEM